MNVDNLKDKMENIFLELGFERMTVGEKQYQYLAYNNCYCRITFLKKMEAFVIESADNIKDAVNEVLEDGDLYYIDVSEEDILCQLRRDLAAYYMD